MAVHVKSLMFLSALAVWGVYSMKPTPPAGSPGGVPLIDMAGEIISQTRQQRITDCIIGIKNKLDDPTSAEFPNQYSEPNRFVLDESGGEVSEVFMFRAKNRFGAYEKTNARCTFKDGQLTEVLAIPT